MKKLGFILLAIFLALGSTGVGYALWSQGLTINGYVNTAKFDVYMTDEDAVGDGKDNGATAVVRDDSTKLALIVDLNNLYPKSVETATFKVKNDSTIPVKLTGSVTTSSAYVNVVQTGMPAELAAGAESSTVTLTITTKSNIEKAGGLADGFTYTVVATQKY